MDRSVQEEGGPGGCGRPGETHGLSDVCDPPCLTLPGPGAGGDSARCARSARGQDVGGMRAP
jgi:hypothetical protein